MADIPNRTLARGLALLELLSRKPEGLELSAAAKALALPKSSAHVLLHTLRALGYVTLSEETGRFRLSLKLFEVGSAAAQRSDVTHAVRAQMRRLVAALNETVHCGVPDGGGVLYIDKMESTHSIHMSSRVGMRAPLYCTAMGKAVLALLPEDARARLLPDAPFPALTPGTVTGRAALYAQLDAVRTRGYAVEREENNRSVCCVGVPVRDRDGAPVYALSVSAPAFRFSPDKEALFARELLAARDEIERVLRAKSL